MRCLVPFLAGSLLACSARTQGFEDVPSPALAPTESGAGGDGAFAGCASASLDARVRPIDLVVMLDRSSSMLDVVGATKITRWTAAKDALRSFFAAAPPSDMRASLSLFGGGVKRTEVCDANTYLVPRVPIHALPAGATFAAAIDATFPGGSTPTEAALTGAHLQAAAIAEREPLHRVAVVFVTDGLPEGCTGRDDIVYAAKVASDGVQSGTPTFVVGVGPNLASLAALAVAGGTEKAFLVDEADPTALSAALASALEQITNAAGACAVDVPSAPAGEQLDTGKVNVAFESTAGSETIARDDDCANGVGWRYERSGDVLRIVLCAETCERAKSAAKVSLVFGCSTVVR